MSPGGIEMRWKREALHEVQQEDVFYGIEKLEELVLPDRVAFLWAYVVGHVQCGADGFPDGWLRYAQPSDDENKARWPVHPAWMVVQSAFCSKTEPAVNVLTGEVFDLPVSPIGEIIRQRHFEVIIKRLAQQMGGYSSTLAAWLGGSCENVVQVFAWLIKRLPVYALPDLASVLPADLLGDEYVGAIMHAWIIVQDRFLMILKFLNARRQKGRKKSENLNITRFSSGFENRVTFSD